MGVPRVAAAIVVAAIALGLTACDPVVDDAAPVALAVRAGTLQVTFCQAVEADRVIVEARRSNTDPWEQVATLEGPLHIEDGSTLDLTDDSFDPGTEISLYVRVSRPPSATDIAAEFIVPEDGMPADSWLKPDGTQAESPC